MSRAELKSKLHQFIDELNDDKILEAVYEALNSEKEIVAYSVAGDSLLKLEVDTMLEEGEQDIRKGETKSHQQVKEEIKSWRKK